MKLKNAVLKRILPPQFVFLFYVFVVNHTTVAINDKEMCWYLDKNEMCSRR